jgi:Ca2+-binding RTX toxin-like protein
VTLTTTLTDGDDDVAVDSATVTLSDASFSSIDIEDDGPVAQDNDAVVETEQADRNIVIVFDRSGSMTADPGVDGFSERIDLARAAVASLLAAAEQAGAVNVLVVDFATDASNSGWGTVDDANAYLASLVAGGLTNYEDATDEVQTAYPNMTPTADLDLVYYLSDGEPTTGDFSDVTGWETFLDTNDITAFAIGIGGGIDAMDSDLEDVAFDGAADPAVQIDPIIVTEEGQLIPTLLATLTVNAMGNVLTDLGPLPDNLVDDFGTDGPGQLIVSITVETGLGGDLITTFTYDSILDQITNNDGLAIIPGSDLTATTDMDGEFTFDFLTGAYTYEGTFENGGGDELFNYTISDGDTDQSTALLTITVPESPDVTGLPFIVGTTDPDVLNGTSVAEVLAGDDDDDTLNGMGGNDLLFGGDGIDTLNGGEGNDILIGGNGDDLVTGGLGADIINVGANASSGTPDPDHPRSQDTVFYNSVLDAGDIIHNFDAAGGNHDTIDLVALFDDLQGSLGPLDEAAREDRVEIVNAGGPTAQVNIDADGIAGFEVALVTVDVLPGGILDLGTDIVVV